ncbi:MAG: DUF1592 domain-containing protein [Planctomycetota bacterium]
MKASLPESTNSRLLLNSLPILLGAVAGALLLCFLPMATIFAQDASQSNIRKNPGQRFLVRYCVDCHQGADADGQRDLQSLDLGSSDFDTQVLLQEAIDQLNLKSMPPEDADQPSNAERLEAISVLTDRLTLMRLDSRGTNSRTVLRQLSRREYRNTVRDLLGVDTTMFDPSKVFPRDSGVENFDTIGDAQVMSAHLLESYFEAASLSIDKAFEVDQRPKEQTWNFKGNFYQQAELASAHKEAFRNRYLCLYDHPFNDKIEGGYGPISEFKLGVPVSGTYEVRVFAKAMHRDSPYSSKAMRLDLDEPFRLGIRPGDTRIEDMVHRQPIQPLLAEQAIMDDEVRWYRFEIPLDKGFAPRFTFENGHHDFRGMVGRLYRYDKRKLPEQIRKASGIFRQRIALIHHAQIPHIRISELEIRGPIDYAWPNSSHALLLDGDTLREEQVADRLHAFAERAFRQPIDNIELASFFSFWKMRHSLGRSVEEAFQDTLKSILCSPKFLFFQNSEAGKSSDYALAERLSYFLTSSMPDKPLFDLASTGKLKDREVLLAQAQRLLESDASDAFVVDFLDSWLGLRSLGSMPPDENDFWFYYSGNLESDSKRETELFFRDMLDRNRPAAELLSSTNSFINRDLAKLYGVKDQVAPDKANLFQRIDFDNSIRGGLLGQSSILTVSANGIDTSPVVRGVWMLENILGTPTPPPPDEVPAIDPDVRGAKTMRDLLDKHRESDTCNECHRKIDPLGFALESFDAVGREREFYDLNRKNRVSTSGELPGNDKFSNLAELKQLLAQREDFFARNLTSKLLTHALGRRMEPSDRGAIDRILSPLESRGYPLQELIESIVVSDLFRK